MVCENIFTAHHALMVENPKGDPNRITRSKHCKNRKTLPWEHNIDCQMCQIDLSKSTEKVVIFFCLIFLWRGCVIFFTTVHTVTAVATVKNTQTKLFHYFWKKQFDTFDNQCDVFKAEFCDSCDVWNWHGISIITDITLYANAKTLDNDAIIKTFIFYHGKRHITISTRIPLMTLLCCLVTTVPTISLKKIYSKNVTRKISQDKFHSKYFSQTF